MEYIRQCHLSNLENQDVDIAAWTFAFEQFTIALHEEKSINPNFAPELSMLKHDTECEYDFADILEEYFDFLEDHEQWDEIIASCDELLDMFEWEEAYPSEYMFRKGDALESAGRFNEALSFGQQWLADYPDDYYAAASNVFLLISLQRYEEAEALTERYLKEELICDKRTDTFFMAAYRLYEITENAYAKKRVEKKIAAYNTLAPLIDDNEES